MKTSSGRQKRFRRGIESTWGVALAASASLIVLSINSQAEACSCAFSNGIEKSLPEDGALGVPTDVVIWAQGGNVELIDEAGEVVSSHLEQKNAPLCSRVQLLTPDAELDPNSTYTLRAVSGSEDTLHGDAVAAISFTTGAGALEGDLPSKPSVRVAAFDASNFLNTCVYSKSQVCMQASYEGLIDVHLTASGFTGHYVGYPEMLTNLEFGEESGETCFQVQARDLAGRLSEATELCVDFSSAPVIGQSEDLLYLDCSDEQLAPYYEGSDENPADPDDDGESPPAPGDEDESPPAPGEDDESPADPDNDDESPAAPADDDESPADPAEDDESPAAPGGDNESSEGSGCSVSSSAAGAQSPWSFGLMSGFVSLLLLVRKRRLNAKG